MKSWGSRLLEFALAVAAAAWLLTWAWQLLRPLAPMLLVTAGVVVLGAAGLRRLRQW